MELIIIFIALALALSHFLVPIFVIPWYCVKTRSYPHAQKRNVVVKFVISFDCSFFQHSSDSSSYLFQRALFFMAIATFFRNILSFLCICRMTFCSFSLSDIRYL